MAHRIHAGTAHHVRWRIGCASVGFMALMAILIVVSDSFATYRAWEKLLAQYSTEQVRC